jgi:acetyltransferase-like isoleucine patch superfamily enzyme
MRVRRVFVDVADHAFASGQVFARPRTLLGAIWRAGSLRGGLLVRRVWRQFLTSAQVGERVRLGASARLINLAPRDRVTIGEDSVVRGILRNEASGRIQIGRFVYVGDGALLSAAGQVRVDDGVLIAHGAQILDNDSHPVDAAEREAHFRSLLGYHDGVRVTLPAVPVHLERRCWIGLNAIVLKGVTVGVDSIVAAGAMVTRDVPTGVVVAGNPAAVVKTFAPSPGREGVAGDARRAQGVSA